MGKFNLYDSISILEKTPSVLQILLTGLPENWVNQRENEEIWSVFDIVGHLVHGEITDWIPRAKIILETGKEQAFAPFDRFAQFDESKGKNINQILEEFKHLRSENLNQLRELNLQSEDLLREGLHPDLGVVKLEQLLATWVVHDLGHIRQIARVLAKNYKSEIGAWEKYLPVVNE
ncbi:MAG: DinB family protein [Pyrinomonadaceae bacterium]